MWFFLYCMLVFFSFSAISLSPLERYTAFLKYEDQQRRFENNRMNILKERLKKLGKTRKQTQASQKQKGILDHEKKQRQFEINRKKAFSIYKKQYKKYHESKKHTLEIRLSNLEKIRQQAQSVKNRKTQTGTVYEQKRNQ